MAKPPSPALIYVTAEWAPASDSMLQIFEETLIDMRRLLPAVDFRGEVVDLSAQTRPHTFSLSGGASELDQPVLSGDAPTSDASAHLASGATVMVRDPGDFQPPIEYLPTLVLEDANGVEIQRFVGQIPKLDIRSALIAAFAAA